MPQSGFDPETSAFLISHVLSTSYARPQVFLDLSCATAPDRSGEFTYILYLTIELYKHRTLTS